MARVQINNKDITWETQVGWTVVPDYIRIISFPKLEEVYKMRVITQVYINLCSALYTLYHFLSAFEFNRLLAGLAIYLPEISLRNLTCSVTVSKVSGRSYVISKVASNFCIVRSRPASSFASFTIAWPRAHDHIEKNFMSSDSVM